MVSDDQLVPLSGGQNYREVGGYPSRDGRRMKRGLVWRSARLNDLTRDDLDLPALRSIAVIADLRLASERMASPTPSSFLAGRTILSWDHSREGDIRPERLFEQALSTEDYADAVRSFYRKLAEGHSQHLAALYRQIAETPAPILIHCSAGKDRTGIAVAILLALIGVERGFIIADYCKTSDLLDWRWLTAGAAAAGMKRAWLEELHPDALAVLMRADETYITAALDDLDHRFGSIDNFAVQGLGLAPEVMIRLKDNLLG